MRYLRALCLTAAALVPMTGQAVADHNHLTVDTFSDPSGPRIAIRAGYYPAESAFSISDGRLLLNGDVAVYNVVDRLAQPGPLDGAPAGDELLLTSDYYFATGRLDGGDFFYELAAVSSISGGPGTVRWGDFNLDSAQLLERYCALDRIDPETTIRAFFELYAEREGKPRWGDKTPAYMLSIQRIGRTLPESRFIHLIRDGRDVALSQTARALNEQPPPAEQGARWVKRIRKARDQAATLKGPRYVEARYEDLVRDPEATLRRICEFVELDWDEGMLSYHERAAERLTEMAGELRQDGSHATQEAGYRIDNHAPTTKPPDPSKLDKWRTQMPAEDLAAYEGAAGEMLAELRYELGAGAPAGGGPA